jgi:protein-tyrosine phosphatase
MRETGRVDVHTHLLPGVDDGCDTVEESLECARALVGAGYTHAFCTPHVWASLPGNNVREIAVRVARLQGALDGADVGLTVMPGGEHNLLSAWPAIAETAREEVVTYGLLGRHLLFDFWADDAAVVRERIEPAARDLRERGFELILAHPERIEALQREERALDRLSELGVRLQLNSWCLAEPRGDRRREMAERLLKEGRYFLIGTDLHRPAGMAARLKGLAVAEELVGVREVERLTVENPRGLMG